MSQSVLVDKMKMLKELYVLADKINKRPEFTFIGKQRYRTENLKGIAQTDSKFITAIIYNSNPLYNLSFITDRTGEILKGVHIESDFTCTDEIQKYINENFYFNKTKSIKDQFKVLEDLNTLINTKLAVSFEAGGVFSSNKELVEYIDRFIKYIEPCYEAIKNIDFNSKKTILRIVKDNIQLAHTIKDTIDKPVVEQKPFPEWNSLKY